MLCQKWRNKQATTIIIISSNIIIIILIICSSIRIIISIISSSISIIYEYSCISNHTALKSAPISFRARMSLLNIYFYC